jgi:hypothetical protein
LTNTGVTFSTAIAKFGSGSAVFNGTSSLLALSGSNNSMTQFAGDFTIEGWIYPTNTTNRAIFDTRISAGGVGGFELYIGTNVLMVAQQGTTIITGATTVSINAWHHVALVRLGGMVSAYLDGVLQGSPYAFGSSTFDGCLYIGGLFVSGSSIGYYFQGYMDEFRITKSAQYKAAFTVPTDPFSISASTNTLVNPAATGSFTLPLNSGTTFDYTLTGNTTLAFPAVASGPKTFTVLLKQGGSGSYTVTWPTMKWVSGSAPTLSTAVGTTDIIQIFTPDGSTFYGEVMGKNFS